MMKPLRLLDLFSGIGGFSLGLERTGGFETVGFCEVDVAARKRLNLRWPGVPIYDDVETLSATTLAADGIAVDFVTAGWPCQDISTAGSGAGIDGERSGLWRHVARLLGELRPRGALLENSSALLHRGLGRVLSDLAAIRYNAEWHCIRASAIGAPFEGDRIYILATPYEVDGQAGMGLRSPIIDARTIQRAHSEYRARVWLEATCRLARMGDGFSDFVDRRERTELLGNAVVPQVVEMIGRAILAAEGEGRMAA
ncbi:MAG: DNA cytosine methyltransferase [Pseudomonadota bacterium]